MPSAQVRAQQQPPFFFFFLLSFLRSSLNRLRFVTKLKSRLHCLRLRLYVCLRHGFRLRLPLRFAFVCAFALVFAFVFAFILAFAFCCHSRFRLRPRIGLCLCLRRLTSTPMCTTSPLIVHACADMRPRLYMPTSTCACYSTRSASGERLQGSPPSGWANPSPRHLQNPYSCS